MMRHSIAVKFIALCLAALSLLAVIGSAAGIVGLTTIDLYDESFDEYYNESMHSIRQNFAVQLIHRYASLNLGNLPEQYLNDYHGITWMYSTFRYEYYYYTIRNELGDVVESTMESAPPGGTTYEMVVTQLRYRALVDVLTDGDEEPATAPSVPTESLPENSTPTQVETIPEETTVPQETTSPLVDTASEETTVPQETVDPQAETAPEETTVPQETIDSQAETAPEETTVPQETVDPQMETAPEETTVPQETVDPQMETAPEETTSPQKNSAEKASETIPPTEAAGDYTLSRELDVNYDTYYDHQQQKMVEFTFIYQDLPPYTVELYLLPDAMPEEYAWTLLRQLWSIRNELFWVLGISALLFAVFMVYLCLAAGRKKGAAEVKAGGLNCLPLDLYLFGGGAGIFFVVALGFQALGYLMRYSPKILVPVAFLGGYLVCLLVVAFLFACAAQFKTKDGYWWRNSITGRALRVIVWLWNKVIDICIWIFARMPNFLKKLFHKLGIWITFLFTWGKRLILWTLNLCDRIVRRVWALAKQFCAWCFGKLAKFYSLLPLMWQWLVTGAGILLFLTFALMTRSEGLLVLAICLGVALILYGASCFGSLLDAAKRMGKGDLETKVNDKNLIGSFKEFAGDLNALADVAVVAAQKQLKSERMKTELITNVSHDIKTPLTSIINYVDLLQKPHTDEEQEAYLEVLSRQSAQLKKLIDDLMEMSKASTGNMAVEISAVNAVEAINQALGEFADKLERIQLTPVFRQPEEPLYMKADGRLAWRVLSNLLSNAYKYALPGTRLYIDLMELEGKVIISMKNISREELNVSADELLERFVRGDASRNTEGSGLGLNIAQSLMELQKGQLQLLVDGDLFKVTLVFPAARIE